MFVFMFYISTYISEIEIGDIQIQHLFYFVYVYDDYDVYV